MHGGPWDCGCEKNDGGDGGGFAMQAAGGVGLLDWAYWGASTHSQSVAGDSELRADFEAWAGIGGGAGNYDFGHGEKRGGGAFKFGRKKGGDWGDGQGSGNDSSEYGDDAVCGDDGCGGGSGDFGAGDE